MEQEFETTTLYEMNKSLSVDEKPLTGQEIENKLLEFMIPFVKDSNNRYFMLLCRERYDFSLFNYISRTRNSIKQSVYDMIECLVNRGDVTSIELTENKDALEIWIKIDNEPFVFFFFPYDLGVIEVNTTYGN